LYWVHEPIKSISKPTTGTTKKGENYSTISVEVVEAGEYPNSVIMKLYKQGDNVKYVDKFIEYNKVGDTVEAEFNLKTSEYQGKTYQNVELWKITKIGATNTPVPIPTSDDLDNDLPF